MKKLALSIIAAFAVVSAYAAPVQLVGSLSSVNGTNYSDAASLSSQQVSLSGFYLSFGTNLALANTNSLKVNVQISIGNTNNYFDIRNYNPSTTNATNGLLFTVPLTNIPVYMRVQVVGTNSVGVVYGN